MKDKATWLITGLIAWRVLSLAFMISRLPDDPYGHWLANDSARYGAIAQIPATPYADYSVEVPPAGWLFLEGVARGSNLEVAVAVAVAMLALDAIVVAALWSGWGRTTAAAYLLISLPLVPFIYFRLDLLSVAIAVAGMALVARKAAAAGGVVLGLAVMTKFWPVVLAPALITKRSWRALTTWAAATAIMFLGWIAWVGIEGPRQVASFRGANGWQIESGVGALLLRFSDMPVVWDADANRIGTAATPTRALLSIMLLAGLAALTLLARHRTHDATGVVSLAAVALLLLLAPILSWQYLIWLAPWAALAGVQGESAAAAAATAAIALSTLLIFLGVELTERQAAATWILLTRNAALVALVALCFAALSRRIPGRWETDSDEPEPTGV